jgi:hypothetical protein
MYILTANFLSYNFVASNSLNWSLESSGSRAVTLKLTDVSEVRTASSEIY